MIIQAKSAPVSKRVWKRIIMLTAISKNWPNERLNYIAEKIYPVWESFNNGCSYILLQGAEIWCLLEGKN